MLTDAAIGRARVKPRAYKIPDERGLHLFVTPSGRKSLRMRYVDPTSHREQTLTFGLWPGVSLDEARSRRDAARAQLARGEDPRAPAGDAAQIRTFETAARAWHAHHAPTWSPVHAGDVIRSLERDAFPAIGAAALDAIDQPAVLAMLEKVEAREAIETGRRLRQRIDAVYAYARAKGWTKAQSPADVGEALAHAVAGGRHAALVDVDELRGLVDAMAALKASPMIRLAARFLALTTVRLGTLRAMRWREVEDLDEREPLWRIPAGHMKLKLADKASAANDHLIPLSSAAAGVLRAVRAIAGGAVDPDALVFTGRGGVAPIGEGAIGALYARTPYAGRHVPHGWRAAFSTVMNEARPQDRAAIDLALAHKRGRGDPEEVMSKVEAAYNRATYLPLRRELLEEWGTLIAPGHVGSPTG